MLLGYYFNFTDIQLRIVSFINFKETDHIDTFTSLKCVVYNVNVAFSADVRKLSCFLCRVLTRSDEMLEFNKGRRKKQK